MNILCFSDLHRDQGAARRIVELSRRADVVLGAGDFATGRQGIRDTIDILAAIDTPAVLVPGNSESFEELQAACSAWPSAVVLHGSETVINGVPCWGLGGAVPETPFGSWSYDFSEDEAAALLQGCSSGGILVTHSPPRGCLDVSSRGVSLGSRSVLAALRRCRPKLTVCGHIHDSGGKQAQLGETTVINAGPTGQWFEFSET